jgi:hypothetical protein
MTLALALICALGSLLKAALESAAITEETSVQDTATKEAARKNFNMQHTLMRRHQQTKLSYFIIVRLLLSPTRVFVWPPHLRPK